MSGGGTISLFVPSPARDFVNMKLNATQTKVLLAVRLAGKASYAQAIADGGNGKTIARLMELGLLTANAPTKKVAHTTYSLSDTGKAWYKDYAKAQKKMAAAG